MNLSPTQQAPSAPGLPAWDRCSHAMLIRPPVTPTCRMFNIYTDDVCPVWNQSCSSPALLPQCSLEMCASLLPALCIVLMAVPSIYFQQFNFSSLASINCMHILRYISIVVITGCRPYLEEGALQWAWLGGGAGARTSGAFLTGWTVDGGLGGMVLLQ